MLQLFFQNGFISQGRQGENNK